MQLRQESYQAISKLLYARAGIRLGDNKLTLVESRLHKRIKQLGLESWAEYAAFVERSAETEKDVIIEALTTHKTDWFRDAEHYQVLLEAAKTRPRDFMVWSAASSTGEEAYSAALALSDTGHAPGHFRILGTDISQDVVDTANTGLYKWGHGTESLEAYQHLLEKNEDGFFQIDEKLKRSVKFRSLNLMQPRLPSELKFDFVFLRNVLIYFDQASTRAALDNVIKSMKPGALLVLGLSETLRFPHPQLKVLGRAVHQYTP